MKILGKDRWELFDLRRHLGIVSMDLQQEFARACSGLEAAMATQTRGSRAGRNLGA